MTILRNCLLGTILLVALFVVAGPVLAVALVGASLAGLFALAVCLWAFVLLGERWIDEGLGGYNYLDALDEALDDVAHGLITSILALRPSSIRKSAAKLSARIVGYLPLVGERAKIVGALGVIAALLPFVVIIQGTQSVRKDFRGFGRGIKDRWAGLYLI